MLVRLKVKLAELVNGLDLSHCVEGDVIEVSSRDGAMLIAERWAEATSDESATCEPKRTELAVAADKGRPLDGSNADRAGSARAIYATGPGKSELTDDGV